MPRDASGNMTLPTGNPVVGGTTISSTVMNNTLTDMAAEMTDSLSRSGKGAMLVPLPFADGTEAAPGITFDSEPTSGLYRAGAGDLRMNVLDVVGSITKWTTTYFGIGVGLLKLLATTITGNKITSAATDQASVVALTIDTDNALTQGKVLSIQNHGVEVLGVGYAGAFTPTPTFTALTLTANWTAGLGAHVPGFWKDPFGFVHLRGSATAATGASTVLCSTVPATARPQVDYTFIANVYLGGTARTPRGLDVNSAGGISSGDLSGAEATAGAVVCLDGVSYYTGA